MIGSSISLVNRHSKTKQNVDFYVKYIEPTEINEVLELQDYIYDRLEIKEIFVRDTEAELRNALADKGIIFGIYTKEGRLAAYRFINVPGENENNMGKDLYMPKSEYHKVVHLETTVVHPDFRGLGLQKLTLDYAIKWTIANGYRYLFCTVSPYNPVSLNNIMAGGLKARHLKKKYATDEHDGYLRYILYRDLSVICYDCWPKFVFCNINDIERQIKLIESGYTGHHFLKKTQSIAYAKCTC